MVSTIVYLLLAYEQRREEATADMASIAGVIDAARPQLYSLAPVGEKFDNNRDQRRK